MRGVAVSNQLPHGFRSAVRGDNFFRREDSISLVGRAVIRCRNSAATARWEESRRIATIALDAIHGSATARRQHTARELRVRRAIAAPAQESLLARQRSCVASPRQQTEHDHVHRTPPTQRELQRIRHSCCLCARSPAANSLQAFAIARS